MIGSRARRLRANHTPPLNNNRHDIPVTRPLYEHQMTCENSLSITNLSAVFIQLTDVGMTFGYILTRAWRRFVRSKIVANPRRVDMTDELSRSLQLMTDVTAVVGRRVDVTGWPCDVTVWYWWWLVAAFISNIPVQFMCKHERAIHTIVNHFSIS